MSGKPITPDDIDKWSRHLWHTSQNSHMVIGLGRRLQDLAEEMREAAGLPELDGDTFIPDAEFGECSVHAQGCKGQETHPWPR